MIQNMTGSDTQIGGNKWNFPETAWTTIIRCKNRSSKEYKEKFEGLVAAYWKPVYKYMRFKWKLSNEEAKDMTQDFFMHSMERDLVSSFSPDKGRFRTFVKACLNNFLVNVKEKREAQKRGGKQIKTSIDSADLELSGDSADNDPALYFDKEWARALFTRSISRMRQLLISDKRDAYLKVFDKYYLFSEAGEKFTRKRIAVELRLKETEVNNYLMYCKQLLKKLLLEEIRESVLEDSDVKNELKYILSLVKL
ncbi:MAG: sigma-70 family RNA polymerase sigma factor [Planctomycetes bacterium]|nr:sigma-70 family RNA polymerase sigma factor [Planctomycetota bacterium]